MFFTYHHTNFSNTYNQSTCAQFYGPESQQSDTASVAVKIDRQTFNRFRKNIGIARDIILHKKSPSISLHVKH